MLIEFFVHRADDDAVTQVEREMAVVPAAGSSVRLFGLTHVADPVLYAFADDGSYQIAIHLHPVDMPPES